MMGEIKHLAFVEFFHAPLRPVINVQSTTGICYNGTIAPEYLQKKT
jgi:hypothetical protein